MRRRFLAAAIRFSHILRGQSVFLKYPAWRDSVVHARLKRNLVAQIKTRDEGIVDGEERLAASVLKQRLAGLSRAEG
jgi:hypothetical protein